MSTTRMGGQHAAPKMTERECFDMTLEDAEVFRVLRMRDLRAKTVDELRREDAARAAARERQHLRKKRSRVWESTYAAGMMAVGCLLLSSLQSASAGRPLGAVVQAVLAGLVYLAAEAAREEARK